MAGRPSTYITLGLQDFVKLAFFYMACVKKPELVGECSLNEPIADLFAHINAQSSINLTPAQLDNLLYHYKQAVLQKLNPAEAFDLTDKEYQGIMKRIKAHSPKAVKQTETGELVLYDYKVNV